MCGGVSGDDFTGTGPFGLGSGLGGTLGGILYDGVGGSGGGAFCRNAGGGALNCLSGAGTVPVGGGPAGGGGCHC